MRLIIASHDDLERVGQLASEFNRPEVHEVRVTLSWLDRDERHRVARSLEAYLNDCSSAWGIPALLVALGWCFYWLPWSAAPLSAAAVTVVVSALVAIVTRAAGVAWCRWRVKAILRRVAQR